MRRRNSQPLHLPSHHACEALTDAAVTQALPPHGGDGARHYADRTAIWRGSDRPDRVFRLKSGRVNITGVNADGEEYLYRTVSPGELFGEMCFCAHRNDWHGTEARSVGRSEVWEVSYEQFRRNIRTDLSMVDSVLQTFCTRVATTERRLEILAYRDARQRLARMLVHLVEARMPGVELPTEFVLTISHSELARLTALSRPHVSVLMVEFRRRGLVAYQRGGPLRIRIARIRRASE